MSWHCSLNQDPSVASVTPKSHVKRINEKEKVEIRGMCSGSRLLLVSIVFFQGCIYADTFYLCVFITVLQNTALSSSAFFSSLNHSLVYQTNIT